jgi:TorA maturation chaperone TorD
MNDRGYNLSEQGWKATLTAHGLAYGFLSKVFYERPASAFINHLATEDLFVDWPLSAGDEETQAGLHLLKDFCAGWAEAGLPDLNWDYNCLFAGPGHLLAPPWESVYLSKEHLVFEAQTLEVRQTYRRFGLQAPKLHKEPDDHLGLELAFMVHLCSLGLAAIENGQPEMFQETLQAQREFMAEHLLKWAPDCLQRVIEHANTDYYRGVAYLTLGCLSETVKVLGLQRKKMESEK